jgi:phage I-like protein
MPIPKPRKDEKQDDYISRCMGDETMNKEYPDSKVRSGVCHTQWRQKELTDWSDGLQLFNSKAEPRDEIMLFPFGEFDHPIYGKLEFNNDFFTEIITNYQSNVLHTMPFMDKQHDEDKALAWFKTSPYIRPGLGLFIKPDYTDLGNTMLSRQEYRYFSPSWGPYKDPQSGKEYKNVLMGGAATNIPFLKTMPPIIDEKAVLDDKGMAEIKLFELTTKGSFKAGGNADDSKEQKPEVDNKTQGDYMEKLIKVFQLSDDATEENVVEKVEELKKENEGLKQEVADLNAKVAELEKPAEGEKALKDELDATKKKLSDMEIKLTEKDRDDVIQKALSEGRIKPADKEYWEKRFMSDPVNVAKDLEHLPQVVDLSEIGKSGENKQLSDDPGKQVVEEAQKLVADKKAKDLTDAISQIATSNPELYKKYQEQYKA